MADLFMEGTIAITPIGTVFVFRGGEFYRCMRVSSEVGRFENVLLNPHGALMQSVVAAIGHPLLGDTWPDVVPWSAKEGTK